MPLEYWKGGGSGSSVLSKTNAEMLALTGSAGQSVYNSTYRAIFDWVVDRWVPSNIDPRYGFTVYEEFTSTTTTFNQNWSVAATVTNGVATATSPGVALLRQATAGARASITQQVTTVLLGTMDVYVEWFVKMPTLATALEDYSIGVGLTDAGAYDVNSLATDGVYFTYNRAVNGANWNTHTVSNGSATNTTNLTSAIVADTWYRLSILVEAGTSAKFYVNGTLISTHVANIPTGAGRGTTYQARVDKTVGSANADLQIDYLWSYGFFNGVRAA